LLCEHLEVLPVDGAEVADIDVRGRWPKNFQPVGREYMKVLARRARSGRILEKL
jgi:hypothetical protein